MTTRTAIYTTLDGELLVNLSIESVQNRLLGGPIHGGGLVAFTTSTGKKVAINPHHVVYLHDAS